ncbi:MAG: hypothetical protein ACLPSF_04360 [Methylocella sp.]
MSSVTLSPIPLANRRNLFRAVLFLIAGALALFALGLSARAAGDHVLIIPPEDGYGFGDCLTTKSACGAVVADAWCGAHGLKASKAFGRAEDLPAPAEAERPADIDPGSFFVACGDKI